MIFADSGANQSDPNSKVDAGPRVVAEAANEVEASMIVALLENAGIESRADGDFTAGFRAEAPGSVQIVVRADDELSARSILAEVRSSEDSSVTDDQAGDETQPTGDPQQGWTHFDEHGASRMVDVGAKPPTHRKARASGVVRMAPQTLTMILDQKHAKGDVLEVARLAGIMAAKRTSELIPLCHPLPIDAISVLLTASDQDAVRIEACVEVSAKTGVEMEALTAVSVAALTIYDMCKAVDRGMTIEQIQLEEKSGGASGPFVRDLAP